MSQFHDTDVVVFSFLVGDAEWFLSKYL